MDDPVLRCTGDPNIDCITCLLKLTRTRSPLSLGEGGVAVFTIPSVCEPVWTLSRPVRPWMYLWKPCLLITKTTLIIYITHSHGTSWRRRGGTPLARKEKSLGCFPKGPCRGGRGGGNQSHRERGLRERKRARETSTAGKIFSFPRILMPRPVLRPLETVGGASP